MPNPRGRWGSACSTTPRWRRCTRGPLGRAARRGGGFRRTPRQRHAGDVRRRRGPVLRLARTSTRAIPAPARPRSAASPNNIVNAPLRPGSDSAAFRAAWSDTILPRTRPFRSRAADRLGRVRRPQGRPAGAAARGNRGLRLDHPGAAADRRGALRRPDGLGAGGRLRPRGAGRLGRGACARR